MHCLAVRPEAPGDLCYSCHISTDPFEAKEFQMTTFCPKLKTPTLSVFFGAFEDNSLDCFAKVFLEALYMPEI